MTKRVLRAILIGLTAVSLMGCTKEPENAVTEQIAEELPEEVSEEVSKDSEEEPVPETDVIEELDVAILDTKEATEGSDNLYYIPSDVIEEAAGPYLYRFQNMILVSYMKYDMEKESSTQFLKLLSCETGEIMQEMSLEDVMYVEVQVLDDYISIYEYGESMIYMYDAELKEVEKHHFPEGKAYVNSDKTKAYCFTNKEGILSKDLASGEMKTILSDAADVTVTSVNENFLGINYVDLSSFRVVHGAFDLETEQLDLLELDAGITRAECKGDVWLAQINTGAISYLLGDPSEEKVFAPTEKYTSYEWNAAAEKLIAYDLTDEGQLVMSLYDSDGTFLSRAVKDHVGMPPSYEPVWFAEADGFFVSIFDETGSEKLYFWDTSIETDGEDLELTSLESVKEIPSGTAVSQELYDQAEEISEKYGVTVRIADQVRMECETYVVEQTYNEEWLRISLDRLDACLSDYPDGFLEQLNYGYLNGIEFNLVGNITMQEGSENILTYISGFMVALGEKSVIGLNIEGTVSEGTIYHEISHIIEDKLQFHANYMEEALFSEDMWASYNPAGFVYHGLESDYPEYFYTEEFYDYFIDQYAGTSADEDRARIMEYAGMGYRDSFEGKQGILDKLDYYSRCIRDCFDTTGWPEVTIWERMLTGQQ